ncbi:MAG: biotin/lipoyl-binding protein, partial [Woeseia sp.]
MQKLFSAAKKLRDLNEIRFSCIYTLNGPTKRAGLGVVLKIADTSAQDVKLAPKSHKQRNTVLGVLAVALLLGGWLAAPSVQRWANATISVPLDRVRVSTVERGNLISDVSVQGRVVAAVSPTLHATAPGTITLHVDAGEQVVEGQVLATIESPELASQLQQAESALEQRQLEHERQRIDLRQQALEKHKVADLAEVALTAANREKRRADQAAVLKVIPLIDHEKAVDDLQNAELAHKHAVADAALFDERAAFEVRASASELRQQELAVDELRRRVDQLAITSPVNGIVGDLLVNQKDAVARDMPVMAVVDLTRFEVEAQIPESYADD